MSSRATTPVATLTQLRRMTPKCECAASPSCGGKGAPIQIPRWGGLQGAGGGSSTGADLFTFPGRPRTEQRAICPRFGPALLANGRLLPCRTSRGKNAKRTGLSRSGRVYVHDHSRGAGHRGLGLKVVAVSGQAGGSWCRLCWRWRRCRVPMVCVGQRLCGRSRPERLQLRSRVCSIK
jgi:hypothetical protein